jgi:hypothetical protein
MIATFCGDAIESQDLHEAHGVTTLTVKLAWSDAAGRPTRFEGMQESCDRIDDVVRSLLDPGAPTILPTETR